MPKGVPFPPDVIARAKALNAAGLPDRAIAEQMADVFPAGKAGYHAVKQLRRRYGWPLCPDAESRRRAVANQHETLGIGSYAQLRAVAYRRFAERSGWPADLPVRAVQILNALAAKGPRTAEQLAADIGMRTDRRRAAGGGRVLLTCSPYSRLCLGHGSYTALLAARGLVAELCGCRGYKCGRAPSLYFLTAGAVAARTEVPDGGQ